MSYFPAYIKLDDSPILVVGGGKIAGDKIEKLLDFTKNLTIISPNFSERTERLIESAKLKKIERAYKEGDVDRYKLVIVAVDSLELQEKIYFECREKKIMCNSVDSVEYCDFIFPSYIKKGDLTIAFSTSGASPSVSKYLREAIEKIIPDSIVDFLEEMKRLRLSLPKGNSRMKLLDKKAKDYIDDVFKGD